jgi:hypothetical protein
MVARSFANMFVSLSIQKSWAVTLQNIIQSHHIFLLMKDIWWQSEKLIHKSVFRDFFFHTVTQIANLLLVCFKLFTEAQSS